MEKITVKQLEELRLSGQKILVDFYGTWCGPCKVLLPQLEQLSTEYPGVKFVKIDVDENRDTVLDYGFRSVPTVMIFNGNKQIDMSSGAKAPTYYREILDRL